MQESLELPRTRESAVTPPVRNIVLVVDLDHTLIKTDILYESFWDCAAHDVGKLASAILRLPAGKAQFKARLSECVTIEPSTLPYNQDVLDYIADFRAAGGKVILVTATNQTVARSIADHLGLFDEVYGSDGLRNLKGPNKEAFLVDRFGAGNFDYIGDSRADLAVWRSARRAISVDAPASLRKDIVSRSKDVLHLGQSSRSLKPYLKAIRPHQWSKNVLVFLPVIAAHDMSLASWTATFFAFIAFSLVASSVYVLNDLLDLAADRAHPRKCKRPLASGAIPLNHGTLMAPGLLAAGLFFSLLVGNLAFLGVMLLYYVATMAYSLGLKRKVIIDICTLAGLYTVRILAGGAATGLPLSVWLLAFSIFIFLSLAAVKRQAELVDAVNSGRESASGRGYRGDDLPIVSMMAISSGYVAVMVMALYINSPVVQSLYPNPMFLWGICPILLYWVSRMAMITHHGRMDDDPIVFAVRDWVSRWCGILMVGLVAAGLFL